MDGGGKRVVHTGDLCADFPAAAFDFIAEFTQHNQPKGAHMVIYCGWYSNRSRGERIKEQAQDDSPQTETEEPAAKPGNSMWAMLIQKVYEVDPLLCAKCGGTMKIVAFIEPPQEEVIEKILKHCGLWEDPNERAPPVLDGFVEDPEKVLDYEYVEIDTFLSEF